MSLAYVAELHKLEWAAGALVAGAMVTIQGVINALLAARTSRLADTWDCGYAELVHHLNGIAGARGRGCVLGQWLRVEASGVQGLGEQGLR